MFAVSHTLRALPAAQFEKLELVKAPQERSEEWFSPSGGRLREPSRARLRLEMSRRQRLIEWHQEFSALPLLGKYHEDDSDE
jgi:hypothetical protein